jgi:hypothetical protein
VSDQADTLADLEALLRTAPDQRTADVLLAAILELRELREALGPKRLLVLRMTRKARALSDRGLSARQIGGRLGLSKSRVQQLLVGTGV